MLYFMQKLKNKLPKISGNLNMPERKEQQPAKPAAVLAY